jgi:hypothetical protein
MSGDYYLVIKGRDGVKRAEVVDMLNLAYTRRVNAPGIVTLDLAPEHHAIAELELDGQVEIWHQDRANGIARSCDFRTLLRGTRYRVDDNGDEVLTATCVGQLHLLSRRIVAYPAHTTGISSIAATRAETVMRTLVATNCTGLATVANGRARDGAITGVSVEPDEARGNVVSWSGPWKNVLGELQDLARPLVGGGDFDLVSTGPQTWVFRFYPGQIGTDRSSGADAVTFSRAFDNMATPDVTVSRVEEKTVAIVGGQGEEDARQISVRTGPDYTAADAIETFVDARNAATLAGLETAGDRALDEARSRPTLTFTPLQTPRTLYRKHYFLGDLVRARYRDLSVVLKVVAVTTTLGRDGDEQIVVELAQP